jgi:hypothetical protein
MLEALAAALEATALSQTLRASIWLYPLVNTAHVVGIALLFGGIVPLDLKLVGAWPRVPLPPLARVLVPMAMAGLLLAIGSGLLLFATKPRDYVVEPLFGLKMALLAAALLNALRLRGSAAWRRLGVDGDDGARRPRAWRVAGIASVLLWLAVIAAGRLIGYR